MRVCGGGFADGPPLPLPPAANRQVAEDLIHEYRAAEKPDYIEVRHVTRCFFEFGGGDRRGALPTLGSLTRTHSCIWRVFVYLCLQRVSQEA